MRETLFLIINQYFLIIKNNISSSQFIIRLNFFQNYSACVIHFYLFFEKMKKKLKIYLKHTIRDHNKN
jgi:hypothetical protein